MSEINYNGLKSFNGIVSPSQFNRLVEAVQAITLAPGANYRLNRTPAGTVIYPKGKGSVPVATIYPFTITATTNAEDDTNIDIRVSGGTMNQFLPTNITTVFTVPFTDLTFVKLIGSSDGEKITSCFLEVDENAPNAQTPTPFSLPTAPEVLLGVVFEGEVTRTIGFGSVVMGGNLEFTVEKTPAAGPGELTYTPYYAWRASVA